MKVNVNEQNQDCSVGLGAVRALYYEPARELFFATACIYGSSFILTGGRGRENGKKILKITQSTGIHSFAYDDYSSRASNSKHSTLNDNNQILQ